MSSNLFHHIRSSTILVLMSLVLVISSSFCANFLETNNSIALHQTFQPLAELRKLKTVRKHLKRINKPAMKTIQSPDGEIIDCVVSHQQPAFDHPLMNGRKPLDPPAKRPQDNDLKRIVSKDFQIWSSSGESCPEGAIPIRRTTEEDILRASSVRSFGKKVAKYVRRESYGSGHEHAIAYVSGEQYYGAKASINVWRPKVTDPYEFSLSQIWIISGSFGDDLNTIEAGWQVSPELYGDNHPRFFTYWTTDAYQATGCYNLLCAGFVQTNDKFAIGAIISPTSSYNGGQFDISILVWKDPKHGNWWLEFGAGVLIGYWPSILFSKLTNHATMIQYGGEIINTESSGFHTSTEMGSGHFAAKESFGKASYFRNLQVVDWDNNLNPSSNLKLVADHPNCYNILQGYSPAWGNYIYYGGPGKNSECP